MADIGITVHGEYSYGDRIGRVSKIQVTRRKGRYSRSYSLPSEEPHMTILVEGREAWNKGEICFPYSIAVPMAKAIFAVAEYAETQEVALPD